MHLLMHLKNFPHGYQVSFGSHFPLLHDSTDMMCLVKLSILRMQYLKLCTSEYS